MCCGFSVGSNCLILLIYSVFDKLINSHNLLTAPQHNFPPSHPCPVIHAAHLRPEQPLFSGTKWTLILWPPALLYSRGSFATILGIPLPSPGHVFLILGLFSRSGGGFPEKGSIKGKLFVISHVPKHLFFYHFS